MALQPDASAGVNTGTKLFILFMIVFLLLNYTIFLSICLGAIAGLAGGFIAAWWDAKEDYLTEIEAAESRGEDVSEDATASSPARSGRYGFGVVPAQQARQAQRRRQSRSGNWKYLSWLPRRKR
jgi:hypothetical protein